jgi:hypothetical protein
LNHGSFTRLQFLGRLVPKTRDSLCSKLLRVSTPVRGRDRSRDSTDQKPKHLDLLAFSAMCKWNFSATSLFQRDKR